MAKENSISQAKHPSETVLFVSDRAYTHFPSSAYSREYPATDIQITEPDLDFSDLKRILGESNDHPLAIVAIETPRFTEQRIKEVLEYLEKYSVPIIIWSAAEQEEKPMGTAYNKLFKRVRAGLQNK